MSRIVTDTDERSRSRDATEKRFRRGLVSTSAVNLLSTAAAGVTGVLIARAMGPGPRGDYAAVMAWFGVLLVAGQLGQTTATTYFVAKERRQGADYVATSRNLLVVTGTATLVLGLVLAPLLSGGSEPLTTGYRLMFVTCIASFLGAAYTFGLQAGATYLWNCVRLFQPVAFAAVVGLLVLVGRLTLLTLLGSIAATIVAQSLLAYLLCRRTGLTAGRTSRRRYRDLLRYGAGQLAGAIPAVIVARLDLLALSVSVDSRQMGQYAVATSLTVLATPLVSAIGSVTLPRLAATHQDGRTEARRLHRRVVLVTAVLSGSVGAILMAASGWLVPVIFGPAYADAVTLILILAPGASCLACGQVVADILRGYGMPLTVAKVQWFTAAVTVLLMAVLLPTHGVVGASVAMTISAATCLALSLLSLRKIPAAGAPAQGTQQVEKE